VNYGCLLEKKALRGDVQYPWEREPLNGEADGRNVTSQGNLRVADASEGHSGHAGFLFPGTPSRAVHRWVLLAPVPQVLEDADSERHVLEREADQERPAGQTNSTHAQSERHQCDPIVGARPGAPD